MIGEKLCKEVVNIVETRGRDYGDIKTNHEEIAKGWSIILGIEVKPYHVALCRKCHTLGHSDKELNEQWKKDLLERIEWKKENPNDW